MLDPKIQRILKKKEKEKERAINEAAEQFDSQSMPATKASYKKGKANNKLVPETNVSYGYGRKNPNVAKKYYSKKQKK